MTKQKNSRLINAILYTTLLAGTLDILSAFFVSYINSGTLPVIILQYVASGLVGKAAYAGGWLTAFYGLLLHYFIAFCFTVFFFSLYPRLKSLSRNTILPGILYGIFVWVVMNLVILPLSYVSQRPFTPTGIFIGMSVLILAIGIPIATMAGRYYKGKK